MLASLLMRSWALQLDSHIGESIGTTGAAARQFVVVYTYQQCH